MAKKLKQYDLDLNRLNTSINAQLKKSPDETQLTDQLDLVKKIELDFKSVEHLEQWILNLIYNRNDELYPALEAYKIIWIQLLAVLICSHRINKIEDILDYQFGRLTNKRFITKSEFVGAMRFALPEFLRSFNHKNFN